jgi:hypothetical protein
MEKTRRHIPAEVQRKVRQECYFGCVVCGVLPYHYDHFDVAFKDAEAHDPSKIALLCPNHHQEKTSKRLSDELIAQRRIHPWNKDAPRRWHPVLAPGPFKLRFGGTVLYDNGEGVLINGKKLIDVQPPKNDDESWSLTGDLRNATGKQSLVIRDSEVLVHTGMWDVEMTGQTLTVRSGPGMLTARLILDGPQNMVIVDRLQMGLGGGWFIEVKPKALLCSSPMGKFPRCPGAGRSAQLVLAFTMTSQVQLISKQFFRGEGWECGRAGFGRRTPESEPPPLIQRPAPTMADVRNPDRVAKPWRI